MNPIFPAMGITLILATIWLWRMFADIKKRGVNPKGKL